MRVALDARLLAYRSAGTATYIKGIAQGLQAADHADELLLLLNRQDPRPAGLDAFSRRITWTPCHHPLERWSFGAETALLPVDVLHSPDFIPPSRLGRRWARVITVHDLAFLRFPEVVTADSRRYYGQIHRAVREAERIIAVSEATRRDLLELVDPRAMTRISVIPEGVEPGFIRLNPRLAGEQVERRFGVRPPYYLFVGTLEPRKNLPRLLRAFKRFRDRAGADAPCLLLAGRSGWLSEDISALAHSLGDAVRFLGPVEREDLVALYGGAVALVLVSLYEGFGLPALEAMACGCPTIVANAGSLPEVVGDAGLLVSPLDEEAIAAALERIWNDASLRQDLAARGEVRARGFRWEAVARETRKVYLEAAACRC